MVTVKSFGTGGLSDRRLHVLEVESVDDLEKIDIQFPQRCAVLVAWDATDATADTIAALGQTLLAAGAVSLCCWGAECARVNEIFDEVLGPPDPFPDFVVTTRHERETLDGAIWYLLFASLPDDNFEEACQDSLILSIGNEKWADRAREVLGDVDAFNDEVLASDDG